MAYRRSRRARGSGRSRISRRRSSRRFSKKSYSRSRTSRRFSRSKKAPKLSVKRFRDLYPDVFMTILKDNHITPVSNQRETIDVSTIVTNVTGARNCAVFVLNANPNGGLWFYDNATSVFYNPNPSNLLEERYLVYRPMGCKIKVTVSAGASIASANNTNGVESWLVGFPFVTDATGSGDPATPQADAVLSNYWDQTATLGLTPNNIPDLKYGWKRHIKGRGSNPSATFSKYYSFAKLLGLTDAQYMAIPPQDTTSATNGTYLNVTCPTSVSVNPYTSIRLCIALADVTTPNSSWNYEVKMTQYGRWETVKMLYN